MAQCTMCNETKEAAGEVEDAYLAVLPVVADEAKRAGCDEEEAFSAAGLVFMNLATGREKVQNFPAFFRVSFRRVICREQQAACREIPVDPVEILEALRPDGQPLQDMETRIWWEQLLDSAGLTPAERHAAEIVGYAALDGIVPPPVSKQRLADARKKLWRALLES